MIDVVRLHHVSFAVKNLDASKKFFGGLIGFEELERPDFGFPGAWYAIGDRQLHLIEQADAGREVSGRISRSDHMALEVEDLDQVRRKLEEAGVEYARGSNDDLGFSQIFCSDPDGHTIEFVRYF
jgi:catechol 2,3-dioxygenase-like lactoylglutathione lyase family enzyme